LFCGAPAISIPEDDRRIGRCAQQNDGEV
jgi:hypothetical protein